MTQTNEVSRRPAEAPRSYSLLDPAKWRLDLDNIFANAKPFRDAGLEASQAMRAWILAGGEETRQAVDVLHGKQLKHPLHAVLTDVTLASWTLAFLFDLLALVTFWRGARRTGDQLTILGTLTAFPTALAGMADYSAIKREAVSYGAAHGLLNGAALFCYVRSSLARVTGRRLEALFFSGIGLMLATAGAWLGGDLVYRHRVGVNHAPEADVPEWTPVLALDDLSEETPTRVVVADQPVLLFREGDVVHAISAVCSHAGGPLDEGRVVDGPDGACIECPWHQSVFDLGSGEVIHSPAVVAQPRYEVRIYAGQVELKAERPA